MEENEAMEGKDLALEEKQEFEGKILEAIKDLKKGETTISVEGIEITNYGEQYTINLKGITFPSKVTTIENNTFDKIMFDVITSKLIETGEVIIKLREKYIGVLNERIKEVSKLLINDNKTVEITYLSDVKRENYKETIISSQKIDILSKTTTRGPQKDDLLIKYDNNDASAFASQGQIRVSVLAIKLAMFELFSYINSNVIMILDDVFSELDTKRQIYLMEYIKKVGQVFITTTEINKLPSNLINESNVIEIKEGESNV